jgi:hypothetical protein
LLSWLSYSRKELRLWRQQDHYRHLIDPICQATQETQCSIIPLFMRGSHFQVCYDLPSAGQIQPCQHSQQALGLCFGMANHECTSICSRRYMGSFRWWMWGGIASSWIHVICLDNTWLPRGVTRFAWWRQDLHAIELLRAHIGEWTMTRMLDYWWSFLQVPLTFNTSPSCNKCFTSFPLLLWWLWSILLDFSFH